MIHCMGNNFIMPDPGLWLQSSNYASSELNIFYRSAGFESNLQVQDFYDEAKRHLRSILPKSDQEEDGVPDNNIFPIIQRACNVSPYFSTSGLKHKLK